MRPSIPLLLVVVVVVVVVVGGVGAAPNDLTCQSCATPLLQNNWQMTNLENIPPIGANSFAFTDKCVGDTDVPTRECISSVCFEMAIPFGGQHEFVRGCYKDFLQYATTNLTSSTGTINICETGKSTNSSTFATHWCDNVAVRCNNLLSKPLTVTAAMNCKETTTTECVTCSRYAGKGKCNRRYKSATCQSAYCTKFTGKIGEDKFEVRGCAPVSPYTRDTCVVIEDHSQFGFMGATIDQTYKATHCFCSGNMCNNPAARPSSTLLGLLILLIVVGGGKTSRHRA